MAGSSAYAARWAFTTEGGSYSSAPTFDFLSDSVKKVAPILIGQGLRGYRARQKEQTRQGPYSVGGNLTANPSPAFLSYMLQWALGGGTATVPAFTNGLALRDVLIDRTGDIYEGGGLAINQLALSSRPGQLAECSIDLVGKLFTAGQSWSGPAALGSTIAYEPLQHSDLTITLGGGAREVEEFSIIFDNAATPKFRNSTSPSAIMPGNSRGVRLAATSIFTADEAADLLGRGGTPDTAASFSYVNGTVGVTFTLAQVKFTEHSPLPQGDEFLLQIEADIFGTAAGNELTVAVDITP
jgi:hypothetical protein